MSIPRNILVATDFGVCSEAAVDTAFDLAKATDATVHMLHVFALQTLQEANLAAAQGLLDAERAAQHHLRCVAQTHASASRSVDVIFRSGDPARLIVATAGQLAADLLVVGTHGRPGADRLRLGQVAERVVRAAPCAVLVVRAPALGA